MGPADRSVGTRTHASTRRWVAAALGGLLAVSVTAATGGAAGASPPGDPALAQPAAPNAEDKVSQEVKEALEEDGRATFLLRFTDRPDMDSFTSIGDWEERGAAVHRELRATAAASQRQARADLEAAHTAYTPFFISNAILVKHGDSDLVASLAADPEVEGIYPNTVYELPEPVEDAPIISPSAVEWGVEDINADDVWSQFGLTGQDIVVANIDTGVDYEHPALVNQYRGNNGDGTFDHDYNWFDAAGTGENEPWDFDAHGTHTMGTMVGDDGGEHQIGVAPGATWIAANGCCPSDEALILSGEWMLAPTDLAGENPDPAMRPHVINNSWGSVVPSNDPFMEDVAEAWAASGIFGVWANGNIGPGCETSGSPGSRIINYSVGNYDSSHNINSGSSRGAGQDGEIKPNISAPGTAVTSSIPGGGYAAFTGTSMATPHVAGAIALLWSADPALVGDIEQTKELLDGTAIDSPDDQCGGTDADNNVFGEGRLDALALLEAAPIGDSGTVEGTVTDASSGDPIAGAQVLLQGERERSVRTGADGTYRLRFSSGDYTVTVSQFGYVTDTDTLTIPVDDTVVHDVALDPAPSGTVSGTVTDGGGQDWPLYARLSVQGQPTVSGYTDPETGAYDLVLPAGTHTLQATAQYPGYLVGAAEVTVAEDGTVVQDFALEVDAASCSAPGYTVEVDGITETFDGTEAPDGWTVEDLNDSGGVWVFEDPFGIPNGTGGEGNFAVVNSDFLGPDNPQDTTLVSPAVDLSTVESPTLGFKHYREDWGTSVAQVELSTDGGAAWTQIWEAPSGTSAGEVLVPLGDEVGADTQVRFHYEADYDFWWQVDDVFVGSRECLPTGGGLVVGYVQNDSDGAAVLGARVTSLDNPTDVGTTRATPDDEALEDGFYWLYSSLTGSTPFEASARNYGTDQQDVDVPTGDVARADFVLGSAVLEVDPTSIETEVQLGGSDSAEFTVTNTGTSPAELTFGERNVGFEILRADGTRMTMQEVLGSTGAPVVSREGDFSVAAFRDGPAPAGEAGSPPRTADEPWVDLTPLVDPILDNRVVSVDGQWFSIGGTDGFESTDAVWRYDPVSLEWMPVAPIPAPAQSSAVGVIGGQIVLAGGWQDGDPTDQTWLYDPDADSWSAAAPMPVATSSSGYAVIEGQLVVVGGCTTAECFPVVDNVQAYDPAADAWNELAPAPQPFAFPVCGALDGGLFCAGGIDADAMGLSDTLLYDPAGDAWSGLSPAPVTVWGAAGTAANGQLVLVGGVQDDNVTNATFGYDPAADAWSDLPAANEAVYRGGGACGLVRIGGDLGGFSPTTSAEQLPGFDECAESGADVPWLEIDTTEAVLEPGDSVTVLVTTDSSPVAQPGTYSGEVTISANTPERPVPVDVAMHVSPPLTWGKVQGTAYLEACDGGQTAGDSIPINVDPVREVGDGWLIVTNHEGDYARWFNTQVGRLRMTASLPGYRPDTHLVDLVRGDTVTQDFSMRDNACEENPEPVPPDVVRVAGVDRYDTASRISQLFPGPVDTVFVATGKDYPDALAAAASSGSQGAPVLLTHPEWLPQTTRIELERLQPGTVVLVGGHNAVGEEVEDELKAFVPEAEVVRYAGANRYETAAIIAEDFGSADVVYVATGRKFPDALAGAARAGALDGPVLLVTPNAVPDATAEQLTRLAPDRIVLLGGTQAVSTEVEQALGAYGPVERVAGPTRYETAALVAQDHVTSQDIFVATGQDWPDALAGAARAADTDVPVLLVKQNTIPAATWEELDRLDPGRIFLLGGPAAISQEVADELLTLE